MNYYSFILGLSLALLFSCQKDEDQIEDPIDEIPTPTFEQASKFVPLAIGNYWVYQRYNLNLETDETTISNQLDSIFISQDTLINYEQFFILEGTWFDLPFYRMVRTEDESLINHKGQYLFDTTSSLDTVGIQSFVNHSLIDSIYIFIDHQLINIETPVGDFISKHQYDKVFYLNEIHQHEYLIRNETELYVENIGVAVYTSFYGTGPFDSEMRLLRYHLN